MGLLVFVSLVFRVALLARKKSTAKPSWFRELVAARHAVFSRLELRWGIYSRVFYILRVVKRKHLETTLRMSYQANSDCLTSPKLSQYC
jgi:hypothetical protein